MDEEDKLPLFGVQPEDLQNIDTGFGSLSENPQAKNALMGNFTSLPVSQARTPSPNTILMGQAAPAGPQEVAPMTNVGLTGEPLPELPQAPFGDIYSAEAKQARRESGPAYGQAVLGGVMQGLKDLFGQPVQTLQERVLQPAQQVAQQSITDPLAGLMLAGEDKAEGSLPRITSDVISKASDIASGAEAFLTGGEQVDSTLPPAATATPRVKELIQAGAITPEGDITATGEEMSAEQRTPAEQAQMNFQQRIASGEPLTPQEIADARYYGASIGKGFDPIAGYTDEGAMETDVARTQAALQRQFGGTTIGDILRQPEFGQATGPQGRMIPSEFATRAEAFPDYVKESIAREQRLAEKPDFGEATGPRTYGGYTSSQLRDMVGGGDKLKQAKALAEAGRDPLTGKVTSPDELERKRIELIDAQLEERGIRPSGPPQVDPVTGIITQMYTDGVPRMKGQIARGGAAGGGQVGQTIASEIAKGQAGDTAPVSETKPRITQEVQAGDSFLLRHPTDGTTRRVMANEVAEALRKGYTQI